MPSNYSFWALHVAIQDSMGWTDSHLHLFRFEKPKRKRQIEIGIPDPDGPWVGEKGCLASWEVPVLGYFGKPGTTAEYLYDFGDGWEHDALLEEIAEVDGRITYPVCLGGQRRCPPEDCGGPHGYADFLEHISDPKDKERASLLRWAGGSFDPAKFDPAGVKFDSPARRLKWILES